jgi:hypothetical protein
MTRPSDLFREEALEFHTGQPRPGGVLRVDPAWTRWSYWIMLALVVVGVIFAATARTSETTSGPALINVQDRTFVALVPDAASSDLQRGQSAQLRVNGLPGPPLAAQALTSEVADQAAIRRAGFASPSQPAVLVTGVLARDADVASLPLSPQPQGRAVVVLGSQRISELFLSQMQGALGKGGNG